jgi:hypothetical protein
MSKQSDDREVFFCDCGHTEHMFIVDHFFWGDGLEPEFSIQPHLCKKRLRDRIAYAWRYLLGKQSGFGAFDSILLDLEDVKRLRDSCDRYLKKVETDDAQ